MRVHQQIAKLRREKYGLQKRLNQERKATRRRRCRQSITIDEWARLTQLGMKSEGGPLLKRTAFLGLFSERSESAVDTLVRGLVKGYVLTKVRRGTYRFTPKWRAHLNAMQE